MKIEAGKYYSTRAGRKAFISSTDTPFARGIESVLGSIQGVGCSWWDTEGRWVGTEHRHDLVAEWHEPATEERVVYMHRRHDGKIICDICRLTSHNEQLALIGSTRVTVTEGVFA